MAQAPEQFMQLGKSSIEAALLLANITLESTERLMDLQLKTAKQTLDQSMRNAQALSAVKNIQDFMSLQSNTAQPNVEQALAYSRALYEVASAAQTRFSKVVEERIGALNGEWMAALDQTTKGAPAGAETAFTAFKSALSAATSAYDTLARATRQTADVTAHKVVAATKPTKKKSH